jgi:hypothetical protein
LLLELLGILHELLVVGAGGRSQQGEKQEAAELVLHASGG